MKTPRVHELELLRENIEIFHRAVSENSDASLIEEDGSPESDIYVSLYELNDEVFLFLFSRSTLCRLMVFENVPAGLAYMRQLNGA